jgi:glycosyltransferase involved in cell wall biosynthesis
MPCYNVSPTVDEALSSLVAQSLTDFEVVAVDDGSTDGTLIRLQDWANRDPRIKILALPHQGIIPALNTGLGACGSELIARMDADDRSLSNRLSTQVEMLDSHPKIAVIGSLVNGFPIGHIGDDFHTYIQWINSMVTDIEIKRGMFIQNPFAHPSVAYRRAWIDRVGGYQDHGWAEDYDLWLRLYLSGAQFGKVRQVLLDWRDHPRRLTHTDEYYSMESNFSLKAHYLMCGPLSNRDGVFIWGTGEPSKRLGEKLVQSGCPMVAFVSTNSQITTLAIQSVPIITPEILVERLHRYHHPAVLVDENEANARAMVSEYLKSTGMQEMQDWWAVG